MINKLNSLFFEIQQAKHALIHLFQDSTVHWFTSRATKFSKRLLLWWCLFKSKQCPKNHCGKPWQKAPPAFKLSLSIWRAGEKCYHNGEHLNAIKESLTWDSPENFIFPNMDANRLHYLHFSKKPGFAFLSKPISGIHSLNISLLIPKDMINGNMEFEMDHTC